MKRIRRNYLPRKPSQVGETYSVPGQQYSLNSTQKVRIAQAAFPRKKKLDSCINRGERNLAGCEEASVIIEATKTSADRQATLATVRSSHLSGTLLEYFQNSGSIAFALEPFRQWYTNLVKRSVQRKTCLCLIPATQQRIRLRPRLEDTIGHRQVIPGDEPAISIKIAKKG